MADSQTTDAKRDREIARFRAMRYVYELIDPRDGAVRYVGCSTDPRKRLNAHLSRSHNPDVRLWIAELRGIGIVPRLRVVGEAGCHIMAGQVEQRHIDKVSHAVGNRLTNRLNMLPVRRIYDFRRWQTRCRMARGRDISYVKRQAKRHLAGLNCEHDCRRHVIRIEFRGELYTIAELARLFGVSRQCLSQRLLKYPVDVAIGRYVNKMV